MQSTIKSYASKACALAVASSLCFSLALFSFWRPDLSVKADAGNYVSYYASACDDYIASGVPAALAGNQAFGVALGTQLALLMIAQQCEIERTQHPSASYDFSDFKGVTGYYTIVGDSDTYYPFTCVIDKYFSDNFSGGGYTALDGGIPCITASHFSAKWFPTGTPSALDCSFSSTSGVVFSTNGTGSLVQFTNKSSNFWSPSSIQKPVTDLSIITTFRYSRGSIPAYLASNNNPENWVAFYRLDSGNTMFGAYNDVMPTFNNLPAIDVTPDNLPLAYDTIIDDIPVPYRIFPDGFPVEEPTEETTEETTESGDDNQPFTLPPSWLETYPTPVIPDPSIPNPSDAVPPTINYEIQRNGLNFWADLWTELIDKTGLGSYVVILLGLSILEWLLWHAGNGGNGKGGEQ